MTALNPIQQQKIRELVFTNSPQGIYQMVLDGTLDRFPYGFWSMPECHDYAKSCTQYLMENVLGWDRDSICTNSIQKLFVTYKLKGMLTILYEDSYISAICEAYPNEFKPWEFARVPNDYWTVETSVQAIRWLYTEKYPWNRNFVIETYSEAFLVQEGFSALRKVQNMFDLIDLAFPNEFKPWEFNKVPIDYWTEGEMVQALRWLYTEKYPWNREFVMETYSYAFLVQEGFSYICQTHNVFGLLDLAFPNEFSISEFPYIGRYM